MSRRLALAYAAALGAGGGVYSRIQLTKTKSPKVCINKACGIVHHTGKPCCSAKCYKEYKCSQ